MKEKKYKFEFLLIDQDTVLTDQNIISFRFINVGQTDIVINNQLKLFTTGGGNYTHFSFDENLRAGEKTAQQYNIVFIPSLGKKNLLQVIQKIEVRD